MQVTRDHLFAGAGLAKNQHAGLGIGHLLHHLPNLADGTTGTHQAAEQIGLALPTALTRLVVHLAIDLGAMQRVEQLVVAGRHLQAGQHAPTHLLRPFERCLLINQQQRQKLIPHRQLLEQLKRTALGLNIAKQHSQDFTAGGQTLDSLAPGLTGADEMLFAEKTENDREIAAALGIVVNQKNLGFTPHLVFLTRRFGGRLREKFAYRRQHLATSKVKSHTIVNFMA